ncbi:MAG: peptidase T [Bacteroidia bacterium]
MQTILDRFIRYAKIDTESDPTSTSIPSTEKQKNLARLLVEELGAIGIEDAEMDEWGYVYATIPATVNKDVPVICYCSHMDTSPDCSGKDVKPLVHRNYQGGSISLPDDPDIVLVPEEHPDLAKQIGNDIVTASGTTLLGADNKAGLAAIMDAATTLMADRSIPHGKIRILFTPDEEIGRGADKVDIKKLGADFGYTVDGETLGSLEDETFSADSATLDIQGVSIHPGFAKNKLENSLKIAADVLAALPKDKLSPETTEEREGFIHPVTMKGNADQATIDFILRGFTVEELKAHAAYLQNIVDGVLKHYQGSKATLTIKEQYRNMKYVLNDYPQVVANAEEAIKRAGIPVVKRAIRGGTDGSRLSYMGLPCPNIFAGEHAFHSKVEWVSVQDMEKASAVLVNLAQVWAE